MSESNPNPAPPQPNITVSGTPPQTQHQHLHQQTPQYQPARRTAGCGKTILFALFFLFMLGGVGVCALLGMAFLYGVASGVFDELTNERDERTVTERVIGGNRQADNKIAVVRIEGLIYSDADGFVARQIRRVMSDSTVKAVVLRVDSPGGTMAGSDYYFNLLSKMKVERSIPVVVSMGSSAASGGYYVSMAGDEIYAEPSTITGSIGVLISLFNASELLNHIGIESTPVVSGDNKMMGSFTKPMTEEEREIWQQLIDDNFNRFQEVIRNSRKGLAENQEAWGKLTTGQVFSASEANRLGLVDNIGFLDNAILRAGELAGMLERDYRVIQYRAKLSFFETLMESQASSDLLNGRAISELSTPRVYVICPRVLPIEGLR